MIVFSEIQVLLSLVKINIFTRDIHMNYENYDLKRRPRLKFLQSNFDD